jgi:hypothetical protein
LSRIDELTLDALTLELGHHYAEWKRQEKEKNSRKDEFFQRVTELCREREPEEKLVTTGSWGIGMSEDKAIRRLEKYHPRFAVDEIRPTDEGFEAIMVERPEFMPFVYVNVEDGMVYQRQVVDGPVLVDDTRLRDEDSELWEIVTFTLPWGDTIVRPLEDLEPADIADLQPYMYRGKPTVKFPAPRKATEEELESVAA